jgi:uncharacterized protein YkwD
MEPPQIRAFVPDKDPFPCAHCERFPVMKLLALTLAQALALALAAAPAAASCVLPDNVKALQAEVLAGMNAQRRARGLPALQMDAKLGRAAQGHACDNAARQSYSHVGSDGSELQNRLGRSGYRYRLAAENTGRGFGTAERAVQWWMNSAHHKDNILLAPVVDVGIGIALSDAPDSRLHWVVNFGKEK